MIMLKIVDMERVWQAVLPGLLHRVVPLVQAAMARRSAGAAADAPAQKKEALKAALLAFWHWLHLVVAPGAVATLDPVALAAGGFVPSEGSSEGGHRLREEHGIAGAEGVVEGSQGKMAAAAGCGLRLPRFPPGFSAV